MSIPLFAAIRKQHQDDQVILLTTGPYKQFAERLGFFDEVWIDPRPRLYQFGALWALRQRLLSVEKIYNLQPVERTRYYRLLSGPGASPEWLCMAWEQEKCQWASHRAVHLDGIPPDLSHIDINLAAFGISAPFAMLVPGSSQRHAHYKRWPVANYAEVAQYLAARGLQPVVVGGGDENYTMIVERCPAARDLSGKTEIADLIGIARVAAFALGNDTGPMHLAALCGCPLVALFSGQHDPALVGARGPRYTHIVRAPLAGLSSQEVITAISPLCPEEV